MSCTLMDGCEQRVWVLSEAISRGMEKMLRMQATEQKRRLEGKKDGISKSPCTSAGRGGERRKRSLPCGLTAQENSQSRILQRQQEASFMPAGSGGAPKTGPQPVLLPLCPNGPQMVGWLKGPQPQTRPWMFDSYQDPDI